MATKTNLIYKSELLGTLIALAYSGQDKYALYSVALAYQIEAEFKAKFKTLSPLISQIKIEEQK